MQLDIEVYLLTGGAGRRMGHAKAGLIIDGRRADDVLAARVADAGYSVTVLGRDPVAGHAFLEDQGEYQGPASALARCSPRAEYVFVLACDVVRFDPRLIPITRAMIGDADAVVPVMDGRLQPLCALYHAGAFASLRECAQRGDRSMHGWLRRLRQNEIDVELLRTHGLDERCVVGANTPEELQRLLDS